MLEIRKLVKSDDLSRAAKILFQADPYIMPNLFGDQKTAGLVGGCLFREEEDQLFCFNRTFVAMQDGVIQGILCYRTEVCLWDEQCLRKAYSERGLVLPEKFERVNREYFEKVASSELPRDSAECIFLAVDEEQRGNGIGSRLLDCWLNSEKDAYYLDVLVDNERAIDLYKRHCFEVIHEQWAYPSSGQKRCLRMCVFIKKALTY